MIPKKCDCLFDGVCPYVRHRLESRDDRHGWVQVVIRVSESLALATPRSFPYKSHALAERCGWAVPTLTDNIASSLSTNDLKCILWEIGGTDPLAGRGHDGCIAKSGGYPEVLSVLLDSRCLLNSRTPGKTSESVGHME